MKLLGEMMLKQSLYLPIAIVAIGGILKSKNTIDEWTALHNNIHSIFTMTGEEDMGILDVLELSYHDLPLFLRPCFLYLASFPEDYVIKTKRLYHLWEAEGLVSTDKSKNHVARFQRVVTLRDIAEPYLEELVSRNMVQVELRNDKGKIKSCRMHDLMRDICIKKATEEDYVSMISTVKEVGEKQSSVSKVHKRLCRLAIHYNNRSTGFDIASTALIPTIRNSKHLRSVLLLSNGYSHFAVDILKLCSKNCLLLRAVDIEGTYVYRLPKEITNLIHLRYLSLRDTCVKKLPSCIIKFQCLQMLDLRGESDMVIPNIFWKLRRLRHLYLPKEYQVRTPLWLHTLSHLETLKNLDLSCCRVKDLHELKSLTRLTFDPYSSILQTDVIKIKLMLSSPNIASGVLAKPMHIRIEGKCLNEELVDELQQLQGYKLSVGSLFVDGKIPMNLQALQVAFRNLTSISFWRSEFEIDPMSVLERLPKLSKLVLLAGSFIGKKMICSTGWFPELIHLELNELKDLEEFRVEEGAMPKLQRLVIEDCNKLKQFDNMLPDTVVFHRFHTPR